MRSKLRTNREQGFASHLISRSRSRRSHGEKQPGDWKERQSLETGGKARTSGITRGEEKALKEKGGVGDKVETAGTLSALRLCQQQPIKGDTRLLAEIRLLPCTSDLF